MYVVKSGKLETLNTDSATIATLAEGATFGELALLDIAGGSSRRSHSLRSVGYSDVYQLTREDALAVLADYPDARAQLARKGASGEQYGGRERRCEESPFHRPNFAARRMRRRRRPSRLRTRRQIEETDDEGDDDEQLSALQLLDSVHSLDETLALLRTSIGALNEQLNGAYAKFEVREGCGAERRVCRGRPASTASSRTLDCLQCRSSLEKRRVTRLETIFSRRRCAAPGNSTASLAPPLPSFAADSSQRF